MKSHLVSKSNIAGNIWTFNFKRPKGFEYIAGQFIELSIFDKSNNAHKRWFTISSSPTIGSYLSITTRLSNNKSTFKQMLNALETSQKVDISDSMGDFVLPRDKKARLLFIVIGIGITPFVSMASFLESIGESRDISVIAISSKQDDGILYNELMNRVSQKVLVTEYSKMMDLATNNYRDLLNNKDYIYISGPEHKVSELRSLFIDKGTPDYKIIGDYFPGY
jgi:ferredoxin-NADP reductase